MATIFWNCEGILRSINCRKVFVKNFLGYVFQHLMSRYGSQRLLFVWIFDFKLQEAVLPNLKINLKVIFAKNLSYRRLYLKIIRTCYGTMPPSLSG